MRHGMSNTPTYRSWSAMVNRCTNSKDIGNFQRYGARGILICDRWRDFANFLADMGERPSGHTLDRIDNRKGYEPGNCQWATNKAQQRNTSWNRFIEAFGERKTVSAWVEDERCAVSDGTLRARLRSGWPIEQAISESAVWRGKREFAGNRSEA